MNVKKVGAWLGLLSMGTLHAQNTGPYLFGAIYSQDTQRSAAVSAYQQGCWSQLKANSKSPWVPFDKVMDYKTSLLKNKTSQSKTNELVQARQLLSAGKNKFQSADIARIRESANDFEEAKSLFLKNLPLLRSNLDLLDSYLYLAAANFNLGKKQEASKAFSQAIYLNPSYEISTREFSPDIVALFSDVKKDFANSSLSSVSLESHPAGAQIYINGSLIGVTPKKIKLKQGEYFVLLSHKGYSDHYRMAKFDKSLSLFRADLERDSGEATWNAAFAVRENGSTNDQADQLLLTVANQFGASKVFLATVDSLDPPRLLGQWFDVTTGTLTQSTLANLSVNLQDLPEACGHSIHTLATLEYNPQENLGIADQTNRAPLQKEAESPTPIYKKWWIYPIIVGIGVGAYLGAKKLSDPGTKVVVHNNGL